jgi:amino acid transporter
MSEEVKDAGLSVPRAMMTSFAMNGVMGLVTLITLLFCIPSVKDAVADPSGFPYLYILRYSMSDGAVTGITVLLLILLLACGIDADASASRQTFAFARDHGLPFSRWLSVVSSYWSYCSSTCAAEGSISLTQVVYLFFELSIDFNNSGSFKTSCSCQRRRGYLWMYHVVFINQYR